MTDPEFARLKLPKLYFPKELRPQNGPVAWWPKKTGPKGNRFPKPQPHEEGKRRPTRSSFQAEPKEYPLVSASRPDGQLYSTPDKGGTVCDKPNIGEQVLQGEAQNSEQMRRDVARQVHGRRQVSSRSNPKRKPRLLR